MIIELLFALMISDVNPSDFTGKTMYPSGIKDCDKDIFSPPASKLPVLKISAPIIDRNGKYIDAGIYQAKLVDKNIIIMQGETLIASLPALKIKYMPYSFSISECLFKKVNSELVIITFRENKIEAETIIKIAK